MEVSEKEFTRGVVAELACEELRARISALESESAQYREAAEKAEAECERLRDTLSKLCRAINGPCVCGCHITPSAESQARAALAAGEG
jgi:predicted nuclease with TOPRIM domain